MALDPLVTTQQVLERLGRPFTAAENIRIPSTIADVSAAVRGDTGQEITVGTSTAVLVPVKDRAIRLAQRPVTAVAAVTDAADTALSFTWVTGDDTVYLDSSWYLNVWELNVPNSFWARHPKVRVTYTHGYAEVPEDLVAVVCQIVLRAIVVAPDDPAIVQESIVGYSYTLRGDTASGPFGVVEDERVILDRYKTPSGPIRMLA